MTEVVTELFAPSPSQIAAARHFAVAAAADLGCRSADLGLVVSELATNACVHAKSPFTVTVVRHDGGILVEVADDDPSPVAVMELTIGPSGRGMHIVASVAKDWGTSPREPGKTVWAVLDCS
jgi:anti-sigma regulatory factor (Ser/Thr protein kinase)